MEKYDVVIIGAGIGGLFCGAFLAQIGYKVAIFEKESYAGGLCSSFKNKGFVFDVAIDSIGGLKEGEFLQRVFRKLNIEKKLDLIQMQPIRRNIFPDFSIDIPSDVSTYKERLKKLFKAEENGINGIFSFMEDFYKQSISSVLGDESVDTFKLRNLMGKSFQSLLDDYLKDRRLKGVLSSYCTSLGLPSREVSAIAAINTLIHYVKGGACRVRGGIQKLTDLLVDLIKDHSGEVHLNEKVEKILTEKNRATGIVTKKQRYISSKYVISNMDLKTLINSMVLDSAMDKNRVERLNKLEVSGSFVIAYIGTDLDLRENKLASSLGCFPSYEVDAMLNKNKNAFFGLSIPSILDNTVAPKGSYNMVAYWPLSEHKTLDKNEIANKLTKQLDRLIPGLSRHILLQQIADAKTLFRYTGNYNGAAYGWKQNAGFYANLPILRNLMENFYITGHWAGLGGGVMPSAISSLRVARQISKEKIEI
ncbi:MAG: NAD(P)/FAD-dependent oxidoreductase [Candidatus Omnitrophica bacterium]|nr:NAD(P)/FAD-dependent oxidoreductase [Candidatus Omnitrophota bacterium]